MTRSALRNASDEVKWRLQNIVRWSSAGGKAQICKRDPSVAFSFGGFYPGGVALADLNITSDCNLSFRFEVTFSGWVAGDVMLGLTQRIAATPSDESAAALETGYEYVLGRGSSPPSVFVSAGSVTQCCFSSGDGSGPHIDSLSAGVWFRSAEMRCAGDWMEFQCTAGVITAIDAPGNFFQWKTEIGKGEVWQPAFAWSGGTASIRIVQCKRCAVCEKCVK